MPGLYGDVEEGRRHDDGIGFLAQNGSPLRRE